MSRSPLPASQNSTKIDSGVLGGEFGMDRGVFGGEAFEGVFLVDGIGRAGDEDLRVALDHDRKVARGHASSQSGKISP